LTVEAAAPSTAAPPTDYDIRLVGLTKRFDDVVAVDNVSLDIDRGQFFALLGPSGCGKTTTLRMIGGFEEPTEGRIELGGVDVAPLPPYKRDVNTVFQSYALFPHLSIFENVAFGLRRRGVKGGDLRNRVQEALELVGLAGLERRKPRQLSGGQQQRIALARSLITEPQVLLLDEPLSALDPFLRVRMREELKRLQRELGITFIHVTHSQDEAMALADLMVVMDQGQIRQAGTPRQIFEAPANVFIARFIGGHNVLPGPRGLVAVRADRCRIGQAGNGAHSLGRVVAVEYQGPVVRVSLQMQSGEQAAALLPDNTYFAAPVQPGDPATLVWSEADEHPVAVS
jgi:putative spermidine/putrescine transport system ATP-binding protein